MNEIIEKLNHEAVFEWWNDFLRLWRVSIKPLLCKAGVAGQ